MARIGRRAGARPPRVLLSLLAGAFALGAATLGPAPTSAAPVAAADGDTTFWGTDVTMGDSLDSAPTITSGTYVTPIPAEGQGVLQVERTIKGSSLWIGASVDRGPAESSLNSDEGVLTFEVLGDGREDRACVPTRGFGHELMSNFGINGFATKLRDVTAMPACRNASSISIVVTAQGRPEDAGDKLQVVVWEEPPVDDASGLPAASRSVAWSPEEGSDPTPIEPGTGYDDAPDFTGTHTFHLDPGDTVFFAMPLESGQHGQALLTREPDVRGDNLDGIATRWVGPMGGVVFEPDLTGVPSQYGHNSPVYDDAYAAATPVVTWRERELPDDQGEGRQPGLPGRYYYVISAAMDGFPADGIDYTITGSAVTDFAPTEPPYTETPGAMPQVTEVAAGPGSDGGGSGSTPWPVVAVLGVGSLLCAAGGVLVLGRYRRAAA